MHSFFKMSVFDHADILKGCVKCVWLETEDLRWRGVVVVWFEVDVHFDAVHSTN